MFSLTSGLRYYLYARPTDMRKSFDGLCGLVSSRLGKNPRSGEVFIFINRRGDRMKLLHWEHGGFVLYYKRLESGTFEWPSGQGSLRQISWQELVMIVDGIVLKTVKKRRRFS